MKQKDVRIGMIATTRIGDERCDVIVMAEVPGNPNAFYPHDKRLTYRVKRVGEDKSLPKTRSAAALEAK